MSDAVVQVRTASPEETAALGRLVAEVLRGGDLVLLTGVIGAGKTAFAQAVAAQLGIDEPVTSPTFLLLNVYEGRDLVLNHFDLYRLEHAAEVPELGIEEALDERTVALVEWADRFPGVLRPPYLVVGFELGEREDDRDVTLTPVGDDWAQRLAALAPRLTEAVR